jgi:fibronectin-binding autotransporter adhesin
LLKIRMVVPAFSHMLSRQEPLQRCFRPGLLLMSFLAAGWLLASPVAAATPRASSVADICPGAFPDPCIVTGKFAVGDGTTFDLNNRALQLSPVAGLLGDNGASFSIINAANVALEKGSQVTAIGKGIDGGSITVSSAGVCTIGGRVLTSTARISGVGGAGGTIDFSCQGIALGDASAVEANGVGGPGGSITLDGGGAPVTSAKGAKVRANGTGGNGGSLTISSATSCTLAIKVELNASKSNGTGGQGGTSSITCEGVTIGEAAYVYANGAGNHGDGSTVGGNITLNGLSGPVDIMKAAKLQANGSAADGGFIQVSTSGTCTLSGKFTVNSVKMESLAGSGGFISASCDSILVDRGGAEANGGFPLGIGGTISLSAANMAGQIEIAKGVTLKATGLGVSGGNVSVIGNGDCNVAAKLQADGKDTFILGGPVGDAGGNVEILCGGSLNLSSGAGISAGGGTFVAGGEVVLVAGGDLDVGERVGLVSNARDGIGGLISADAGNNCRLAAKFEARGVGVFGLGGGVSLTCVGDAHLTKDAQINVGGPRFGIAGNVAVQIVGSLQMDKGSQLRSDGTAQLGINTVDVSAGGQCTIAGKIQSDSSDGPGNAVSLVCTGLTFESSAQIQLNSRAAEAGHVLVDTTGALSGQPPAACVIDGKIRANSMSVTNRSDPENPVVVPGTGGTVQMSCGTTLNVGESASIDTVGAGAESAGGYIQLVASAGATSIGGRLNAKAGSGAGGFINLIGVGIATGAKSSLDVSGFQAGGISLLSRQTGVVKGDVTIGKGLTAKGSGGGDNVGGAIQVEGCDVTIDSIAQLQADGKQAGQNELIAHKQLTVHGKVKAVSSLSTSPVGVNTFKYRDGLLISNLSNVVPAADAVQDTGLSACP